MFQRLIIFLVFLIPTLSKAQEKELMYGDGKINVVIAVITVIFVGLGLYLYSLDRKISKIEDEE
ncbi:MAG: CcmD family protein [Bacteroidota bacterium]|jgi:CcmD family protein